ncbi:MAG TPA: recombinase family protein [Acidimicrobiales bacterium]|nr:recombinase family protein [Acidimicrobiales bacterium]
MARRAFGIVRQSRTSDDTVSIAEQRKKLAEFADREGMRLVEVAEEVDVSGGRALAKRPGLRRAVEMVETGQADVIVVAYFDRLVRSLTVQAEILQRVEAAGGGVAAMDVGEVSNGTASKWLSATMLGMVAEYHRRSTAERTAGAKADAVARGVPPFPRIPFGLRRRDDGTLEPDPETADLVVDAFEMRADRGDGEPDTIDNIRDMLAEHGHQLTHEATKQLLRSRLLIGELRFGKLVNLQACEPVVDRALFDRVQAARPSRGRTAKSQRLLARLGVLRCGSCGGRLIVNTNRDGYVYYACGAPRGDCQRRAYIGANRVERFVSDETVRLVGELQEGASAAAELDAVERQLAKLKRAVANMAATFDPMGSDEDVADARKRLSALRGERDAAQDERDRLARIIDPDLVVDAEIVMRDGTLEERRSLIRDAIDRAIVSPGRLPVGDRVEIVPRRESFR